MIKDEDPRAVSSYVLSNDLGPISNGKHCRWARLFISSLKLTLRKLKRNSFEGFELTTFTHVPEKKRRFCRYVQGSKDKSGSHTKAPDNTK